MANMTKKKQNELLEDGYEYLLINDTETTGLDSSKEGKDRIIQTGHALYLVKGTKWEFVEFLEENIAIPVDGLEIGPRAAEVHGIWYEDLEGCPTFDKSKSKKRYIELMEAGAYIIQHNGISFDLPMLEKEGIFWPEDKVIDTMVIGRHDNPTREEFPQMKEKEVGTRLQAMRYFWNFDGDKEFQEFMKAYKIKKIVPHTALADILVLAYYTYKKLTLEKVFTTLKDGAILSRKPILSTTIEWGQQIEKGSVYSDIIGGTYTQYGKEKAVIDYLDWGFNKMDRMGAEVKLSIATEIFFAVINKKINAFRKFSNGTSMEEYVNFAVAFNPAVYDEVSKRYTENPGKISPSERAKLGMKVFDKLVAIAKKADNKDLVKGLETLLRNQEVLRNLEK